MRPSEIEQRSLEVGKWGNLVMAVAGVLTSVLSQSDALLVDGLYSAVNFFSAIIAAKITATVALPPDRRYPFGYDAHEALYVTFRSLVLLGILAFAVFGAIEKIIAYASGSEVPELRIGPIIIYSCAMTAICIALALWHWHNWRTTGRQSEILRTESRAALVDAVISGGVGGGFAGSLLLSGTSLEFIVPISDSIIVLLLVAIIAAQPIQIFRSSLRQVVGASAEPATVERVRSHLKEILQQQPFDLLDVAVTKMGRSHYVLSYVRPDEAIDGKAADDLWKLLDTGVRDVLNQAKTELVLADQPPFRPPETETRSSDGA